VPPRSLVLGSPAKRIRELTGEEVERVHRSAASYVERARLYREQGIR
jgi:carbonic anhydrase/acetyltransferase-like protein (isoleucine patch superfamily)